MVEVGGIIFRGRRGCFCCEFRGWVCWLGRWCGSWCRRVFRKGVLKCNNLFLVVGNELQIAHVLLSANIKRLSPSTLFCTWQLAHYIIGYWLSLIFWGWWREMTISYLTKNFEKIGLSRDFRTRGIFCHLSSSILKIWNEPNRGGGGKGRRWGGFDRRRRNSHRSKELLWHHGNKSLWKHCC